MRLRLGGLDFTEAFGPDGDRLWIQPRVSDSELDAYIARQRTYDPDLWVVEIEDRQGRRFITDDGGARGVRIPHQAHLAD